jgi:hypothetical protein
VEQPILPANQPQPDDEPFVRSVILSRSCRKTIVAAFKRGR